MTTENPTGVTMLQPGEILIAEFNYIAQTAFQAGEDRSRVSSFYFVTAGAAIGALLSTKVEAGAASGVYAGLAGLFLVLTVVGLLTLLQLARLRAAWQDSARAMNVIKDYYCKHHGELNAAFLWRTPTIPEGRSRRTVSFLLACSVLAITFATATAAMVYAVLAWNAARPSSPVPLDGIALAALGALPGILLALGEYVLYERWLSDAEQVQARRVNDHYLKYSGILGDDNAFQTGSSPTITGDERAVTLTAE